jgi:hypothetical protein
MNGDWMPWGEQPEKFVKAWKRAWKIFKEEKAGNVMHEAFGERMKPAGSLGRMLGATRLGRKNGRGFYKYKEGHKAGVDTLVLGCTHYPLLGRTIGDVMGQQVVLISSAEETAFEVHDILEQAFHDHWEYSQAPYEEYRKQVLGQDDFDPALWLVAFDAGQPAGALTAIATEDILATLGEVERKVVELMPQVPLYYRAEVSGVSRHVGNFQLNPSLYGPVWNIHEWFVIE